MELLAEHPPDSVKIEKSQQTLQKLHWREVRDRVFAVNEKLATLIDEINPTNDLGFYRIAYPYGASIVQRGHFHVVTEQGHYSALNAATIADDLKTDLNYRSIPLCLLLRKNCEVFIEDDQRIVPMRLLRPGELFGVFEILDRVEAEASANVTNVSAGARSAFMLAKISDSLAHRRLSTALNMECPIPKSFTDHSDVFETIMQHPKYSNEWQMELLCFSKEWFTSQPKNFAWSDFMRYLSDVGWAQSHYWRTATTMGLLWKTLNIAIQARNVRPRNRLIDTIKHLIFIISGAVPGFAPAQDEDSLPLKILQKVYVETYGLKSHAPIIMAPEYFSSQKSSDALYYSLSHPTLIESSLDQAVKKITVIEDLRTLKVLIECWQAYSEYNKLTVSKQLFKQVSLRYFSCDKDLLDKIEFSAEILESDARFATFITDGRTFPSKSLFWRGCIQIKLKKTTQKSKQKN